MAQEINPETYDGDSVATSIVMFSVFMLIVAGLMAMWASYSGILRYVIMLTFVSIVLMIPAYVLFQSSARSVIKAPEEWAPAPRGNLEELSSLMKRAFDGYQASQAILEDRLREDLIERISIRKRLGSDSIREISRDWKGALRLTGDEDLARLLFKRKKMGREKKVFFVRPSKEYREWIMRVITKMEEWK